MIVIGARGHAKEILEILFQNGNTTNLCFFDNVSSNLPTKLCSTFPVITTIEEAEQELVKKTSFISALGNPRLRSKIVQEFIKLGGEYQTVISRSAQIGNFDVKIGNGCNIMSNVFISNSVKIGEGCLINQGASIHHDVQIGSYCDVSPKATLLGRVTVGHFVSIGAGAIILPGITIEDNAIIGAGSIVTKNVTKGQMVFGNPAKSQQ